MEKFKNGAQMPLWFEDIEYVSVATANYSPSEDESLSEANVAKYVQSGFVVMNCGDDAGYVEAITWEQYRANSLSLTGLTPRKLYAASMDVVYTPIVKVYAADDVTYPSSISTLNIGIVK